MVEGVGCRLPCRDRRYGFAPAESCATLSRERRRERGREREREKESNPISWGPEVMSLFGEEGQHRSASPLERVAQRSAERGGRRESERQSERDRRIERERTEGL